MQSRPAVVQKTASLQSKPLADSPLEVGFISLRLPELLIDYLCTESRTSTAYPRDVVFKCYLPPPGTITYHRNYPPSNGAVVEQPNEA